MNSNNIPPGVSDWELDPPEPAESDPYIDLDETIEDLIRLVQYVTRTKQKDLRRSYLIQEINYILSRLEAYNNE